MKESATTTLSDWGARQVRSDALLADYRDFAEDPAHTHRETSTAQHLTVSAFVFNDALDRALLCFHKKGLFWLQLGGHIEQQDASLLAAARREAVEESGLRTLEPLSTKPVDLDRHALSGGFGSCRVHWDIGFAFTAPLGASLEVSDESEDVGWWPVDALPEGSVAGLGARMHRIIAALR